ncbi:MAG: uroporphyrinogen decarboxylase family protein [bacterium]|nr:uroporphyrinogen decarboxylase family protein [bacterium]
MCGKSITKRERYLSALKNEAVDELVWAPNFDYWLSVNTAEGTVPQQYAGMSRNDIVRAVGGCIWNRTPGLKTVLDKSVEEVVTEDSGNRVRELRTPVGTVRGVHSRTEGAHRSMHQSEHFIKDVDSLKVMKYIAEATYYEADYAGITKALEETGDDGIVLSGFSCLPFIQFAKTDAGYVNGFYLWADHKQEVDALIEAYTRLYMRGYEIMADSPADVIFAGDNMDGTMISPSIFKEYAVPFYQEAKEILAGKGKIFQGHWCGRTQTLLPLVPECGLDVVEAIVSRPMADVSLSDALDMLQGKVVLQGGVPAVLVCEEGGSRDDFKRYIEEVILPLKGRQGFILGMSDNVPPNADFARVEMVAELIR